MLTCCSDKLSNAIFLERYCLNKSLMCSFNPLSFSIILKTQLKASWYHSQLI
ncbi:hypothetical protein [uncultured Gammaproteobacteria bacterium]|nr:hypothetical protein [uncultured Gammaproteobacteria bacterium]CAC9660520.1 hypothetical protein [uncultured Gammaproteobacteria bacterium]CAC9960429.1 hypothetical protein [uncultured Gammaproteobacteria bacterium]CAC9987405.1 hypothetical protein [uncultured Gammaproteobacteria bacterium]VVH51939.1 hypothetical protein BPUTSESOX_2116 [uncultured Gammaproteobacteria bacterium]